MIYAVLLLILGLFALFLEFYLPGGLMAVIGVSMFLTSIFLFAWESSSTLGAIAFAVLATLMLIPLFKFTLWRIKSARPGWSVYSADDQEGYQASSYNKEVVGKSGCVVSDLRPSGKVKIDDKFYQALSQGDYIEKGAQIIVIGGQEANLIVKRIGKAS